MKPSPQNEGAPAGRSQQRGKTRYLYSAPVLLWKQDSRYDTYGISLEISETGCSALLNDELQVGERVQIRLHVPAGTLYAAAVIRHHTGRHYGMEFEGLTEEQIQMLRSSSQSMQVYGSRLPGP